MSLTTTATTSLTGWQYSRTIFSSTRIKKYTMLFVIGAMAGVIGYTYSITAASAAAIPGVSGIASSIVSDEIPNVYYGQDIRYKYVLGVPTPLPRAESTTTWFFSDKARQYGLGDKKPIISEYYVPGWK